MTNNNKLQGLTYAEAGVNIDAGNALVERIKSTVIQTARPECLGGLGGFAALFELNPKKYQQPVLVSATDGVGTKLKLAQLAQQYSGLGIDLVAMCVNDLVVCGAEPLFFLDYYACGKLDVDAAAAIVASIGIGCQQAGAALVGGETAEMPGVYQQQDFDLAGFAVGMVEKANILGPQRVTADANLIAIASSGPHSNGYSLIRRIIQHVDAKLDMQFADSTLGEHLLTPTRIYVKTILKLASAQLLQACAHITGGGLVENVIRAVPDNLKAVINTNSWQIPEIFTWLQKHGQIQTEEMWRVFNCGVGMVLVVAPDKTAQTLQQLASLGEIAWQIGHVAARTPAEAQIEFTHG